MNFIFSKKFDKKYILLPAELKKAFKSKLALMMQNKDAAARAAGITLSFCSGKITGRRRVENCSNLPMIRKHPHLSRKGSIKCWIG